MSQFTPTKRHNPCPICSDIKGKCRLTESLILCMNLEGDVPGYKFLGLTKDGLWSKFVEDNRQDWSEQRRTEWRLEQQRLKQQREQEEKSRRALALSAVERDRLYQQLLHQLTLDPIDRADLKRRGLTDEEIQFGDFRSVTQWQKLEREIDYRLPGVILDGRSLNTPSSGYIWAIRDVEGNITGQQLRLREETTGGRFRWLTSATKKRPNGATPHLPNGELPLAVHRPKIVKIHVIGLIEGTGVKPFLTAQRQGQMIIGAAGGQFAASPKTFKVTLDQLSQELEATKEVILYPDAGATENPQVMRQYRRTAQRLKQWGYSLQVAWWGQVSKEESLDADEMATAGRGEEIEIITFEQFESFSHSKEKLHSFSDLLGWLPNFLKQLGHRGRKTGFLPNSPDSKTTSSQKSPLQYKAGDRLKVWSQLAQSHKFIFDSSGTGTGKSFDTGQLTPEMLGVDRVVYITGDPRNPTTSTLEDWTRLSGRHQGLKCDDHGKIRRSKKGETYSILPNCGRVETLSALREFAIDGADTSGVICQTCPQFEACRGGHLFGYLNKRAIALKSNRLTAHPASLPNAEAVKFQIPNSEFKKLSQSPIDDAPCPIPNNLDRFSYDQTALVWEKSETISENSHQIVETAQSSDKLNRFSYEPTALVWEEWGTILKNTQQITVTSEDVDNLLLHLIKHVNKELTNGDRNGDSTPTQPDLLTQLRPILTKLFQLLSGEIKPPNCYGWNHRSLLEQLPPLPDDLDWDALATLTQPNLDFLNPTKEEGVDMEDLPAGVRKRFTRTDEVTSQKARDTLLKQWIIPFLEVLSGTLGYLWLNKGQLSITTLDERLIDIAQAATKNIFLDATADLEELALLLGVSTDDIIHIQQELPSGADLEIFQVSDLGRLGIQRGDDQQRRVEAIIKHLKALDRLTGVIRFKRYAEAGDYRWHIESRGVNDGEKLNTLILDGTPCPNLESLKAEFACLNRRVPIDEDESFSEFVNRRIEAEIQQAVGRLRANCRPGEKLRVYILGDFPMGVPVTVMKASDITLEAAGKVERVEMAIRQAVEQLQAMGQKVTQQAIADLTGYSRGHISRFQKLIVLLIKGSISKMSNAEDLPSELDWFAQEYLPIVAALPPRELLTELELLIQSYGIGEFSLIWQRTSVTDQIRVLERLLLGLPRELLLRLAVE